MTTGVVVMAYGTPRHRGEVEAYYTDIRRGSPPSAEQLADLVARYDAIGGLSPLRERTEAQAAAIATALGDEYLVAVGLRHAEPSIEDAVAELVAGGTAQVVGLVLAPHYSAMSVGVYHERAAAALRSGPTDAPKRAHNSDMNGGGARYAPIDSWATEPVYVDWLAGDVAARLDRMPAGTHVLFTAHSLPRRILDTGDPYPAEVAATAAAVAKEAGLAAGAWSVGWQSAGQTSEPWLGPDVGEVIDELAADGAAGLLVCPCGFTSDHLEVLYDLDIQARAHADERGLRFARTAVVNDDSGVMTALARRVIDRAAS